MASDLADLVHALVKGLFDPYRPEHHYMRGSGPKQQTVFFASSEIEILTPTGFLDQIARSPRAARELIQRLSQRLREANDRIVNDERRSGRAHKTRKGADSQTAVASVNNAYLAPRVRGCSVSSALHLGSTICRRRWPGACCMGRASAIAAGPQAR